MTDTPHKKGVFASINERLIPFLFAFIGIFIFTLAILSWLDATPVPMSPVDPAVVINGDGETAKDQNAATLTEQPIRVEAKAISLNQKISNPVSSDIKTLDEALLKNAVHYPGSANLGQNGNVVLFGHSSYLRTVFNPAYKEFNDIQKLKTGETITVYSGTTAYDYRVTSVKFAKADDFVIDLTGDSKRVTLVTCNSFATKSDRFVVEAEYVMSYPIAQ